MEAEPSRRFETTDRINLQPTRIGRITQEVFENQETTQYLATKFQSKLDFKDQVSSDDGTNKPVEWKRLGGLIVHQHSFPENISETLRSNGVDTYPDESVLELHIPPQEMSFSVMTHSMKRLYEYLDANKRARGAPMFIYGLSYLVKPLSKFIQKYGFHIAALPPQMKAYT